MASAHRERRSAAACRATRARAESASVQRDIRVRERERGRRHVRTDVGRFLFLALVLDTCTRLVFGGSMARHLRTGLVLDALDMALAQRPPEGAIHHSKARNARLWPSERAAGPRVCDRRWARPGIASTMPCARAASPRSTGSCSSAAAFAPWLKRSRQSSFSLRAGTTRIGRLRRLAACHRSTTKGHGKQLVRRPGDHLSADAGKLQVPVNAGSQDGARPGADCRDGEPAHRIGGVRSRHSPKGGGSEKSEGEL